MFGFSAADLGVLSVLDCCAGGSSFTAETAGRVVAADPAYSLDRHDLARRVRASLHEGGQMIAEHAGCFDWSWYGTHASRERLRAEAAGRFLADIRARPARYIAAALPRLPLASASFDLVLCSHLLFTWANLLDADWHRQALAELTRVARHEVRIYPTVVQGTGRPVAFLGDLRAGLHAAGYRTRLREVPYRFQRDAHQMLVITARQPASRSAKGDQDMPVAGDRAGDAIRTPVETLRSSAVTFSVREHVPVTGHADAERELGLRADQMLKTMVFRARGTTVLVALPARGRVHYGKLAKAIGVQRSVLRQAEPDDLARIGMVPGGASPVCGTDGVITVFDVSVLSMATVFCGSGRTDQTVQIQAKTLVELIQPIIATVTADGRP